MHEVYYGDLVFAMTKRDFVEGRDKKPCSIFAQVTTPRSHISASTGMPGSIAKRGLKHVSANQR